MTVYADYNYYTTEYLAGKSAAVTAADFPYYAKQASAVIDQYTFGNINAETVPDEVKMCCCDLVEQSHAVDTSESVQKAVNMLFENFRDGVPMNLLSQFMPVQYNRIRLGQLDNDPESLVVDRIGEVIDDYMYATDQKELM